MTAPSVSPNAGDRGDHGVGSMQDGSNLFFQLFQLLIGKTDLLDQMFDLEGEGIFGISDAISIRGKLLNLFGLLK